MNISALLLSIAFIHTSLTPTSSTQFFITPETEAVIAFESISPQDKEIAPDAKNESKDFLLLDVNGTELQHLTAIRKNNLYTLTVSLPQGYYELRTIPNSKPLDKNTTQFTEESQSFGLVSLPAFCDDATTDLQMIADPFYAIDGAMSWLIRIADIDKRAIKQGELAEIARRSGITMIRERYHWQDIQPKPGIENMDVTNPELPYDRCRKAITQHGVQVLEVSHDAPVWMERTGEKYPQDFLALRDSWEVLTQTWNRMWGGMEVWNEPDISFAANLPADQYVPVLKTIAWQQQNSLDEREKLSQTGKRTTLVGGVLAGYNRQWLDTATASGILDACDAFSFHTYAWASEVEELFSNYQSWLRDSGQPTKPVWLTECGRPWRIGPGRPPQIEDITSAIDIVMKGVEARAFGLDRYFPFVFPYYEERKDNFGMMSRDYTPLRSFAGYAQSIRVLAHRKYIGDLNLLGKDSDLVKNGWTHARVFSTPKKDDSCKTPSENTVVAVLYAPEIKARTLTLPCRILRAERVTGEAVALQNNNRSLESPDSFVYVWLDAEDVLPILNVETPMMKHYCERKNTARNTNINPNLSPIILRYELDEHNVSWNAFGYEFSGSCKDVLTLSFHVTNLSPVSKTVPIACRALCDGVKFIEVPENVNVPGNGTTHFQIRLVLGIDYLKMSKYCPIEVTAEDRIIVKLQTQFTLAEILETYTESMRLDILDHTRWSKNVAVCCDASRIARNCENWTYMAHFTAGDHWVFPMFNLPENVNLADYHGVVLRIRCWDFTNNTQVRFFTYQPNGAFFTASSIIKTDGEWHVVQIPFDILVQCTAAGGKPSEFQPEDVRRIAVGANTKSDSLQIEMSELYLYKK